jgi:3-dehydroquinate synthase
VTFTTITLKLPAAEAIAPIWIGRGAVAAIDTFIDLTKYSKVVVVGDSGASSIIAQLSKKIQCESAKIFTLQGGESCKSVEHLANLWQFFRANKLDRRSLVIGVGGGALTDLTGFAAATYMRGVAFISIPTTLLAQVDAGIGGKNGINLGGIKNLVGTISQPVGIIVDVDTLDELPARDLRSGFAEIVKHGLITDSAYFKKVTSRSFSDWGRDELAELVLRSCEIKVAVVQDDPYEQGKRRALNFGHTLGHAIEACSLNTLAPMTHGEAVAIGMVAACHISSRMGFLTTEQNQLCTARIAHVGLPTRLSTRLAPEALLESMTLDKKNVNGVSRWTLLRDIGDVVVDQPVPEKIVAEAIEHVQSI